MHLQFREYVVAFQDSRHVSLLIGWRNMRWKTSQEGLFRKRQFDVVWRCAGPPLQRFSAIICGATSHANYGNERPYATAVERHAYRRIFPVISGHKNPLFTTRAHSICNALGWCWHLCFAPSFLLTTRLFEIILVETSKLLANFCTFRHCVCIVININVFSRHQRLW